MKSGIYHILNKQTLDRYIGSSVDVPRRVRAHKSYLRNGKHVNKHLQLAYLKYGADEFLFEKIEECGIEELVYREQFWIDKYPVGLYNKTREAALPMLGRKHSEETLAKFRARKHIQHKVPRVCVCGTGFEIWPHQAETSKYCSAKCYHGAAKGAATTKRSKYIEACCLVCEKGFSVREYLRNIGKGKYCSKECCWEDKRAKRVSISSEFKKQSLYTT